MKEEKKKLLNDYINMISNIRESVESERVIVSTAVREMSATAREYAKQLIGADMNNMTAEQKRIFALHQSITEVQSVLESFKISEMMGEKYIDQLVSDCSSMLEKIKNDNSASAYVSKEDDKEYRKVKERADNFFEERTWFLQYFNAYSGMKIVKLGGKPDKEENTENALEKTKRLESEYMTYIEKRNTEGLTQQEELELEILTEKFTIACNKLEMEAINEFLEEKAEAIE